MVLLATALYTTSVVKHPRSVQMGEFVVGVPKNTLFADGAVSISAAQMAYARGHRLTESATDVATAERGLSREFCDRRSFYGVTTRSIRDSMFAWMLAAKRLRMTLPP